MTEERIAEDDPRRPEIRALLQRHLEFARAQTPPEHSFALDMAGLLDPAVSLFSVQADGGVLGIGAIKRLGPHHAEIKSMHTAEAARGRGIGRAMLAHLLDVGRARGYRRVSLETGTMAAFAAARALYESAGFVRCGPFGDYQPSEDNMFMTLDLDMGSGGGQASESPAQAITYVASLATTGRSARWSRTPSASKTTPPTAMPMPAPPRTSSG